jgi:hypothetical protein
VNQAKLFQESFRHIGKLATLSAGGAQPASAVGYFNPVAYLPRAGDDDSIAGQRFGRRAECTVDQQPVVEIYTSRIDETRRPLV